MAVGSPLRLPVGTDDVCVVYEIPGASFLSISLLLFVGGRVSAPGSYLCGNYALLKTDRSRIYAYYVIVLELSFCCLLWITIARVNKRNYLLGGTYN